MILGVPDQYPGYKRFFLAHSGRKYFALILGPKVAGKRSEAARKTFDTEWFHSLWSINFVRLHLNQSQWAYPTVITWTGTWRHDRSGCSPNLVVQQGLCFISRISLAKPTKTWIQTTPNSQFYPFAGRLGWQHRRTHRRAGTFELAGDGGDFLSRKNVRNSPVSNSPWPLNKNTDSAFVQG